MSEAKAVVEKKRRINAVWFLPILAAVLGGYMVVYTFLTEGPTITITFRTAEGLAAGKTAVKALNVDVGIVETVELADDLTHVIVTAKLDAAAAPLLREDSRFWVVRARVGAGGVTGLGTILSGGYIELAPGEGEPVGRRHRYMGLETPPVTTAGTPGVQIALSSEQAGSVSAGDPVVYNGYTVGRIDTAKLDANTKQVQYTAFIDAPYDVMVSTGTRFWNASGIDLDASAQGIELRMASITTLIVGGVEFGVPDGVEPGTAIQNGHAFKLYRSYKEAREEPYQ
jgi:paraquat-inducible protein B